MAGFDVRKAKCTVPTDREAIEQQVKELFKEAAGEGFQRVGRVALGRLCFVGVGVGFAGFVPLWLGCGGDVASGCRLCLSCLGLVFHARVCIVFSATFLSASCEVCLGDACLGRGSASMLTRKLASRIC